MNCLIRIRQRYAGFAQSDKKLADFLLSQPDHARHLSSQQLASEAGVSQSSVVKFAQKIGFKGFPPSSWRSAKRWLATPTRSPCRCIIRSAAMTRCGWLAKS